MELLKALKTKKDFKPIYLWKDESHINAMLDQREKTAQEMTAAILEVEALIDRSLTTDEKGMVLIKRWDGVVHLLRLKTGFPNAEVSALLGLLGLDAGKCKEALIGIKSPYYATEFVITEKAIEVNPTLKEELEKRFSYYTSHNRQNIALSIAENLANVLNNAVSHQLIINIADMNAFERAGWNHSWAKSLNSLIVIESGKVVPNNEEIWRIKE
ncbi:hypothetical protein MWU78_21395 [Arenibacter sp. F26102]|uniref:hypothetical protein n=1 Tax=Arenibacter sp. F26102 TaxID=2926416 RepID=UPI001FF22CF0|nr:hypothetical protein [Arenibacter sp. F26102]MCK0148216.1 hypothetical protein [Arenibacter sp. F26102]